MPHSHARQTRSQSRKSLPQWMKQPVGENYPQAETGSEGFGYMPEDSVAFRFGGALGVEGCRHTPSRIFGEDMVMA